MGNVLKRYNGTSWEAVGGTITGDTLPIGSIVEFDGSTIPVGWEEVSGTNKIKKVSQVAGLVGGVSNTYSESTNDAYSCDYVNGTVLYDNSAGGTFPVTISDNYANYSKIEVYLGYIDNNAFTYGIKKITCVPTIATNFNDAIILSGDNWFTIEMFRAAFGGTDGKTLSITTLTELSAANGAFSVIAVHPSTNLLRVVKVIGYK